MARDRDYNDEPVSDTDLIGLGVDELEEESVFGSDFEIGIPRGHNDARATPSSDSEIDAENRLYDGNRRLDQPHVLNCQFKLYTLLSDSAAKGLTGCRRCSKVKANCGYMPLSDLSQDSRQALVRLVEKQENISDSDREKLRGLLESPFVQHYRSLSDPMSDTKIMHGDGFNLAELLKGIQ